MVLARVSTSAARLRLAGRSRCTAGASAACARHTRTPMGWVGVARAHRLAAADVLDRGVTTACRRRHRRRLWRSSPPRIGLVGVQCYWVPFVSSPAVCLVLSLSELSCLCLSFESFLVFSSACHFAALGPFVCLLWRLKSPLIFLFRFVVCVCVVFCGLWFRCWLLQCWLLGCLQC